MGLLGAWPAPMVQAATPKEIDDSITKAKAFLYSQFKDGNWEERAAAPRRALTVCGLNSTGETALVTYALLAAGEVADRTAHCPGIGLFAAHADQRESYALGLRCQVWLALPEEMRIRPRVVRNH